MKLIDKSALVAEITKRAKEGEIAGRDFPSSAIFGLTRAYKNVLSFLDTLEVKDVDLAKEIDKFYGMYRKNGITFSIEDNQECLDWKEDCNPDFEIGFARHFFELGIQQSKNDNNNEEKK